MPEKSAWAQWSEADIRGIVQPMIDASIAKIPIPAPAAPGTGIASWTVKDWGQFALIVTGVLGVFGFGAHGYQKGEAIKNTVDAVQVKQDVQEKKAEEVKDALVIATGETKKSFKAAADSLGDSLKIVAEAREATAKEPDATPEEKKIAVDARAAYQAHVDRQKNGH